MTDTTTRVHEHYSVTDLTGPDYVGTCGDSARGSEGVEAVLAGVR
jgi:hypothetical protein